MAREWTAAGDKVTTALTAHGTLRTYAIWAWRDAALAADARFWEKRDGVQAAVETLRYETTGAVIAFARTWSGATTVNWGGTAPSADAWHHIVCTYDSGSTANNPEIYSDASAISLTEFSGPPSGSLTDNTSPYVIGNRGDDNARTWDGRLAEFAVWNAILTQAEITALSLGISPLLIRPTSLGSYVPLSGRLSNEPDWKIAGGAVVTGTARIESPRLFLPRGYRTVAPAAVGGLPSPPFASVTVGRATL